ncbi:GNAT family protein [Robbsia sp. Bb-Pol-6]|uniref:GNAT family protein n=1 Tax=Robbsia betulipollinis TaxID=2981849 RepID=A0ABT3ZI04_9BURK|nr:GNAT family protein [Robbsia betulipollinis]MCY0386153.1 GNAT family protein [Robbsia betulipollinis]
MRELDDKTIVTRRFVLRPLKRSDAEIDTRNQASTGTIEKLGFERVRVVPQADYFKGAASDEYHYSYRVSND